MKHLKAINRKAAPRRAAPTERRRRRRCSGTGAAAAAALPDRLLAGVLARLGSRSHRRHRRALPAGRARSVRLPHRLLLAGAGARPAESRAGLDRQVRRGAEGLAQDRSGLPVSEARMMRRLRDQRLRGRRWRWSPAACRSSARRRSRSVSRRQRHAVSSASYPKQFWIIDEATEKVVGTIPFQSGIPRRTDAVARSQALLHGRSRRWRRSRSSTSRRARRSTPSR